MLQEPIQARGDAGVLQKLLDGLNTLAAKEFFRDDGEAPLSQFGLDPPRYRVVVESIGARERHEVLIGADCGDEPGREIYVSRADGVQVFRCDDTVTAYFALAPDDWRDRRALPFADYGWVRSVTLRGPSTDWSITRIAEDADWALTNRVRQAAVSSPRGRGGELVDTIGRILVGRYVSDGHIGAESFRVTVQVDGLPEPMILIFGEAIERGRYLARRQGVEGEADAILDIATTLPERYAEDVLVQPLVRARVRREQLLGFELRSAQGRWLLVQVAGWQVDGYPEMRIDQSLVSAALDVVLQPTAVFFEQGPVRLDDLRLTPARCTFRVGIPRGLGEFPYHELLVGSRVDPSGTVAYAKLDSDPLVFIMDPSALAALAAHLAEMCAAYDAIRDGDLGPRQ